MSSLSRSVARFHSGLHRVLATCVVFFGLQAFAQPTSGPTVKTKVSLLLIGGAAPVPDAFLLGPQKATTPVKLSDTAKSPLYAYEGPAIFSLYVPIKGPPPTRREIFSCPLPPASQQVLIVLAPSPKATPEAPLYTGTAVDDDWAEFGPGSVRLLNFSGKALKFQVGTTDGEVAKGPSKAVRVVEPGKPDSNVPFQIWSQEGDKYLPAFKSTLPLKYHERATLVVLPPKGTKARGISFTFIREPAPLPDANTGRR
jgi:hypothetical protein